MLRFHIAASGFALFFAVASAFFVYFRLFRLSHFLTIFAYAALILLILLVMTRHVAATYTYADADSVAKERRLFRAIRCRATATITLPMPPLLRFAASRYAAVATFLQIFFFSPAILFTPLLLPHTHLISLLRCHAFTPISRRYAIRRRY